MTPAIHFGHPCGKCGRAVLPATDRYLGNDELRGRLCEECFLQHQTAWRVFVEKINSGEASDLKNSCAECHVTVREREARTGSTKMFLHEIAGGMFLLCPPCSQAA